MERRNLRRFFTAFLFEDLPAADRRADTVYLDQVDHCAVYVGLCGTEYGFEDADGVSPTEREFDRATARGKPRFIFVKGADDNSRHPKMSGLVRKAESQLMRRRFGSVEQLRDSLYSSLVEFLEERGLIQNRPFEERPSVDASLADINADALTDFVRRARHERQFPLPVETPVADVLTHLHLLREGRPTHAAVLLFGRDPQRFVPAAELRCMHFHGAEIQRPVPFYRIFKGSLFEQVDRGADFVLSVLNRTVGTRNESAQAPVTYEIPPDVVREAIVNAIAHRDYSSAAAVQVSVFADRVEILNPGDLPPPLTPERLREPHGSIARNHRVCEALFQARYIEKYGTGTLMMIRLCREHGLAEPRFEQRGGEFGVTLGRDWLTPEMLKRLNLNDRQRRAVLEVKLRGRIGNLAYQRLTGAIKKTASRDLEDLVAKEVFSKAGTTGRGTHYVLAPKGDIKGTSVEPQEQKPKRRKGDSKGPKGTFSRPKPGRRKGDKGDMSDLRRFSSRRQRLDHAFLSEKLKGAKSYRRIAGYFRSSIFELVGEEIAAIPKVQIVCNSELDAADIVVSKHVRETALKERWNEVPSEVEALLHRDRYRRLHDLLTSGRVEIRVVPKDRVFIHGKAGVIETADGAKSCFLGSINETKSAFTSNYEILWEDTSSEGVGWVEEEFEALWNDSFPLPDAIIEEIKRVADRVEIRFEEATPDELPAAALAESPIYRGGEQLQPWQRSFVTMFLQHRETYGKARLLLADEVGVGKTLSLAASAMISSLLDDGHVLILCPSTLTLQWQVELADKLGIPSAVWSSTKKVWLDPKGHVIKTRGAEDIARCPFHIAIVSTGLIVQDSDERQHLLEHKYGTVVLDEAHKARRRGGLGTKKQEPNNLLDFMLKIGPRTRNLLLGTATPIQTEVHELWDLLRILNAGADFVLGRELYSAWGDWERALPVVKGDETPADEREAWEWMRNPLPPGSEDSMFATLRLQLDLANEVFFTDRGFGSLGFLEQQALTPALSPGFLREHNPIVRHTVLRRRQTLEEAHLLEKVGVEVHPDPETAATRYPGLGFSGLGLLTNLPFDLAYQAAEAFTTALQKRTKAAGFMKTLLLQRICSSFASGRATAEKLLRKEAPEEEERANLVKETLDALTPEEAAHLRSIVEELSRPEARDPKLAAVQYFLTEHRTEGKTWLEHGCIVFSQYYDTAYSLGAELARLLPGEPVGVYAGTGKSGLFRREDFASVEREDIKAAVKKHQIRLLVATDAACEGLNLQTLGTLINVDLPWNPSRLEQRLGRIKRFGQARWTVDMLNLVYHGTQDEKVYQVLSRRMKDRYDVFGGLPDTIEDEWIESEEKLEQMMDEYIHLRTKARDVFEMRYQETIDPDKDRWDLCSRVLARRDVVDRLSAPW